jgi:hypothetical protein
MIKLKYSGVLWLATAGTIITNLLFALAAFYLPTLSEQIISNPLTDWNTWIEFHYQGIMTMLLPMFLVILCALSVLQENRSDMWKVLYALPFNKGIIYLSKLKVIILLFVLSHFLFILLMMIFPSILEPSLISESIPMSGVFNLFIGTIISSLGILGLVFWVSYYSRSFVLPLAVGILGFVVARLLRENGLNGEFFPFAYPVICVESIISQKDHQTTIYLYSLLWFAFITTIGTFQAGNDRRKFY